MQITSWCHNFITQQVKHGDICIDATAGNGHDTLFLCNLIGDSGRVYAFDIQESAIYHTKVLIEKHGLTNRCVFFVAGHENMFELLPIDEHGKVSCIMFNLGYLPGGNHDFATKLETTLSGIQQALEVIRVKGLISILIYRGGDTGFFESEGVLAYLKSLDSKKYLVITNEYYNRPNNPPILVLIYKLN